MDRLLLRVAEVRAATPFVRTIRLTPAAGGTLPAWEPGAHINVRLPSGDDRSFSLVNCAPDAEAMRRPESYLLGVRLETPSTGGSVYMHGLVVGDTIAATPPSNNFRLEPAAKEIVLVAGGIGVTPILSMAAALEAAQRPYRLFYAGRGRDQLAFLKEALAIAGSRLHVHVDDEAGGVFDLPGLMAALKGGEPLYLCGPRPMIEAGIAEAARLGWEPRRLRFEHFTKTAARADDSAFDVTLQSSGRTFTVPPDKSILDVLIEAGIDPMYDCRRGECGICQVGVVEGEPDHRDHILSDAERAGNKVMQICVSRAKTPRLVIDL